MTPATEKPAIGFIGLGDLGLPLATRIRSAGFELAVWNRTAAKMAPLVAAGALAAASPADVATRAEIVCVCVDTPAALASVVFGPDGIASAARRPKLLLDNSTTHPQLTREFAARLKTEAGIGWLDVPVSGGAVGARAGTLAAMAGGAPEDLDAARELIMAYAGRVTLMGPVGCGQATKACNQIINFGAVAALAEAITLGDRFGIDTTLLPQALAGGFADSNILQEYGRCAALGDFTNVSLLIRALSAMYRGELKAELGGGLGLPLKDIGIALELGRHTSSAMPLMGLLEAQFRVMHNHRPVAG